VGGVHGIGRPRARAVDWGKREHADQGGKYQSRRKADCEDGSKASTASSQLASAPPSERDTPSSQQHYENRWKGEDERKGSDRRHNAKDEANQHTPNIRPSQSTIKARHGPEGIHHPRTAPHYFIAARLLSLR